MLRLLNWIKQWFAEAPPSDPDAVFWQGGRLWPISAKFTPFDK